MILETDVELKLRKVLHKAVIRLRFYLQRKPYACPQIWVPHSKGSGWAPATSSHLWNVNRSALCHFQAKVVKKTYPFSTLFPLLLDIEDSNTLSMSELQNKISLEDSFSSTGNKGTGHLREQEIHFYCLKPLLLFVFVITDYINQLTFINGTYMYKWGHNRTWGSSIDAGRPVRRLYRCLREQSRQLGLGGTMKIEVDIFRT